jgi:DNA-binding NarL/FixJ family response regulator
MGRATRETRELPLAPEPDRPHNGARTAAADLVGSPRKVTISVFLVDSRTVVREGLCALIDGQPGLTVVGQAGGVGSLGQVTPTPDVVVTEIELADARGPDVIRLLRAALPGSSILVLTLVDSPARVQAVLAAGADGYLLKTSCGAELTAGIRAVAFGTTYLQPSLGVALGRWHSPRDSTVRLTPAEERILGLLALGHTNAEMAHLTGVSVRTVETHRGRILQKLGSRTRAELVQYAWAAGLIDANSR